MVAGIGPERTQGSAGFTLIEVLIAVAILAILATGASLAVARGPVQSVADAQQFSRLFEAERSLAVQGRDRRGLALEATGYRHAKRDGDGLWRLSDQLVPWRGRAVPDIANRYEMPGVMLLVFLPNGRTSRGSVLFATGAEDRQICRFDGWEGVACDPQ